MSATTLSLSQWAELFLNVGTHNYNDLLALEKAFDTYVRNNPWPSMLSNLENTINKFCPPDSYAQSSANDPSFGPSFQVLAPDNTFKPSCNTRFFERLRQSLKPELWDLYWSDISKICPSPYLQQRNSDNRNRRLVITFKFPNEMYKSKVIEVMAQYGTIEVAYVHSATVIHIQYSKYNDAQRASRALDGYPIVYDTNSADPTSATPKCTIEMVAPIEAPTSQLAIYGTNRTMIDRVKSLLQKYWPSVTFPKTCRGVAFVQCRHVPEARSILELLQQRLCVHWSVILLMSENLEYPLGSGRRMKQSVVMKDHKLSVEVNFIQKSEIHTGKILQGLIRKADENGVFVDVGYNAIGYIPKDDITIPVEEWKDANTEKDPIKAQVYVVSLTEASGGEKLTLSMKPVNPPRKRFAPETKNEAKGPIIIDLDAEEEEVQPVKKKKIAPKPAVHSTQTAQPKINDPVAKQLDESISKHDGKSKTAGGKTNIRLEGFKKVKDMLLARKSSAVDPVAVRLIEYLRDTGLPAATEFAKKCVTDLDMTHVFNNELQTLPPPPPPPEAEGTPDPTSVTTA